VINIIVGIITMIELIRDACKKRKIDARAKVSAISVKIKRLALHRQIRKNQKKAQKSNLNESSIGLKSKKGNSVRPLSKKK
jgi:hypothetical protein